MTSKTLSNAQSLNPSLLFDGDLTPWIKPLQDYLSRHIPLCRTMGITVVSCTGNTLVLNAPLAPNINDKGTAFGGAIASLLTVTGWGVVWLLSQHAGLACDIVVRQSQLRYLRPAQGGLIARCALPTIQEWCDFERTIQARGRARITLKPELESEANLASVMVAEYAGSRITDTQS